MNFLSGLATFARFADDELSKSLSSIRLVGRVADFGDATCLATTSLYLMGFACLVYCIDFVRV